MWAVDMTDLLTVDDIATRVGESREYVRDKVVKRPDFPRPTLVLFMPVYGGLWRFMAV